MRARFLPGSVLILSLSVPALADAPAPVNPRIDMDGFLRVATEAARHRESRRVSEAEFIRLSRLPGTIVLDARSRDRYDLLHVKGAIHLSFPDIAIESLERVLPDRNARILIYCNNNFANDERAFMRKIATASLNLSTYVSLYDYGYRNVWELGPLLDVETTKIELVSTAEEIASGAAMPVGEMSAHRATGTR